MNGRDRLTRQEPLNRNTGSMRAKLVLFAVCPRRQRQVAPLTVVVTGVLCCADKDEEMLPGERATAAEEGRREFQHLRHAGVCVCVCVCGSSSTHAAQASSASGLTVNGATLCTVSRSNSSIIYRNEELGISTANCK